MVRHSVYVGEMKSCYTILLILNFIRPAPTQVNLALNGIATQKSTWQGRCHARHAVTGVQTNTWSCEACATTNGDNNRERETWWMIDLMNIVYVSNVNIWYRSNTAYRFAGYHLYLSNTTSFKNNSITCYKDVGTELPSVTQSRNCDHTGRYVTIYNERRPHLTYPPGFDSFAMLELCHVEIYGCPKTKYGHHCDNHCSAKCFDTHCFPNNGSCVWGCNCIANNCNNSPTCKDGCKKNFAGQICNEYNVASVSKATIYPSHIENSKVIDGDKRTNSCLLTTASETWLQIDFGNLTAITAVYLTYKQTDKTKTNARGHSLYLTSTAHSWTQSSAITMTTDFEINFPVIKYNINNAALGRYLIYVPQARNGEASVDICEVEVVGCPTGYYGQECKNTCPKNCYGSCHLDTGKCSFGCNDGWMGERCETPCEAGYFGNCTIKCHCLNGTCDRRTGFCSNNECDKGWTGTTCSEECSIGRYGYDCKEGCDYCVNRTCDSLDGNCTYGYMTIYGQSDRQSGIVIGIGISVSFVMIVIIVLGVICVKRKMKGHSENVTRRLVDKNDYSYADDSKQTSQTKETEILCENVRISMNVMKECKTNTELDAKKGEQNTQEYLVLEEDDIYQNDTTEANMSEYRMNVNDLRRVVQDLHKDNDAWFENEFQMLPKGLLYDHSVATEEKNKTKNRFLTIFPYNHSRVVLQGNSSNDYINASYIESYSKEKAYIAAQGPKKNTKEDFWRMIWQESIEVIVMLTKFAVEKKKQCSQYWPETSDKCLKFGNFTVSLVNQKKYTTCIYRVLRVKDTVKNIEQTVNQFEYVHWPDHGVPDTLKLVSFYRRVKQTKTRDTGPILVHCSSGVGNTGTYIAIDALHENGAKTGCVDVLGYAQMMRKDRMNMIHKVQQYATVYEVLMELFTVPCTIINRQDFCNFLEEQNSSLMPKNKMAIRQEYQKLQELKPVYTENVFKIGTSDVNVQKNVDQRILPHDDYRPCLISFDYPGRNDYINAVILPTHKANKQFLVTQYPLKDTVVDFWTMVYDFECTAVVLLEDTNLEVPLWAVGKDIHHFANFELKEMSEPTDELVILEFNHKKRQENRLVGVHPMTEWKTDDVPASIICMLILLQNLKSWLSRHPGSVAIVCRNGCHRSGVFAALSLIFEKLEMDDEVDIFQTIRIIQKRRPEFLINLEQYLYCYQLLNDFLKEGGDYEICDTLYANN